MGDQIAGKKLRIAALGDMHILETDRGKFNALFADIRENADILLIAGDLTHSGDEEEAAILLEALKECNIPILCVLGNHDFEKGREKAIRQCLLQHSSMHVLDGEGIIIEGVGFAGVKGFGGGFDNYMLAKFGEKAMKDFVAEAVEEALKLERALVRLDKENTNLKKIALMHYAPCSQTIRGEPEPIYPFLGSSRLAEPLIRQKVEAAFHGHAHAGILEGKIAHVRVFNVAQTVLKKEGLEKGYFVYLLDT